MGERGKSYTGEALQCKRRQVSLGVPPGGLPCALRNSLR